MLTVTRSRQVQFWRQLGLLQGIALLAIGIPARGAEPGIIKAEWIYESAPFPECHASTLAETQHGLIAAWFGGTSEKHPDVGIWISRHDGERWTTPLEVANGVENPGKRYPCWNPVLFQAGDHGLLLFYKVGPSPETWWGMLTVSKDEGQTWGKPTRLPNDILGPIKNKPVLLDDGRLLCGSSTEHDGWKVHLEWTSNQGLDWIKTSPVELGGAKGAIQPTILVHKDGGQTRLQILCRSQGDGKVLQSWSNDGGRNWEPLSTISLPNPNSGIDAVTLKDGRHVLVYNHTPKGRVPLNVALTSDGKQWLAAATLETTPGEYSYPAVIQTADGLVHLTYTWKRQRIRHVVLDPAKLNLRPIVDGKWPE